MLLACTFYQCIEIERLNEICWELEITRLDKRELKGKAQVLIQISKILIELIIDTIQVVTRLR